MGGGVLMIWGSCPGHPTIRMSFLWGSNLRHARNETVTCVGTGIGEWKNATYHAERSASSTSAVSCMAKPKKSSYK